MIHVKRPRKCTRHSKFEPLLEYFIIIIKEIKYSFGVVSLSFLERTMTSIILHLDPKLVFCKIEILGGRIDDVPY